MRESIRKLQSSSRDKIISSNEDFNLSQSPLPPSNFNKPQYSRGSKIIQIKGESNMESSSSSRYGWLDWRPEFLQDFLIRNYGLWPFLAVISYCACIEGFIVNGMINVIVTSIEKQFQMSSSLAGAIVSAYDISFLLFATPVSFLGGQSKKSLENYSGKIKIWLKIKGLLSGNKIRILSSGMFFMGLGSLIFATPQFISPPYLNSPITTNSSLSVIELCHSRIHAQSIKGNYSNFKPNSELETNSPKNLFYQTTTFYFLLFFIGNFFHGIGSCPLYTLGVTYIDENVPAESVSFYLGLYYAISVLGPALGFLFGAFALSFPVDLWKLPYNNPFMRDAKATDPNWVGAWWMGFLFSVLFSWVICLPLSGFPTTFPGMSQLFATRPRQPFRISNLKPDRDNTNLDSQTGNKKIMVLQKSKNDDNDSRKPIDELPLDTSTIIHTDDSVKSEDNEGLGWFPSIMNLLQNRAFLFVTLGGSADGLFLNGFSAFLPKYLEIQFDVPSKTAALWVGVVTIPAGLMGMFLGGFNGTVTFPRSQGIESIRSIELANPCNGHCECMLKYQPVCDVDRSLTYHSACYAGCSAQASKLESGADKFFKDCLCIASRSPSLFSTISATPPHGRQEFTFSITPPPTRGTRRIPGTPEHQPTTRRPPIPGFPDTSNFNGVAKSGKCNVRCGQGLNKLFSPRRIQSQTIDPEEWKEAYEGNASRYMIVFLCFMFLALFFLLMVAVISVNATLKCVESSENSLAMGIQWVFVRLLGSIPGPIIFGKIIDLNCLLWDIPYPMDQVHNPSFIFEYGSCNLYNNKKTALSLLAITVICKCIAQTFYGLSYYYYAKYHYKEKAKSYIENDYKNNWTKRVDSEEGVIDARHSTNE
ncbi:solute carrier organic anion transporter family member 4C1-like isoform X2 [Gordionus sp. m RMFG-2023]|uniref:solute carrier organic anion transporter family member 4C1-like isoform X2 n=1 Tax=Gordionus sp. m RMFG-2023 TaxID=3053472 RepID=UPI0031FC88A8